MISVKNAIGSWHGHHCARSTATLVIRKEKGTRKESHLLGPRTVLYDRTVSHHHNHHSHQLHVSHIICSDDKMRDDFKLMKRLDEFIKVSPAQRVKRLESLVEGISNSAAAMEVSPMHDLSTASP